VLAVFGVNLVRRSIAVGRLWGGPVAVPEPSRDRSGWGLGEA
jgi:hypothetical protein